MPMQEDYVTKAQKEFEEGKITLDPALTECSCGQCDSPPTVDQDFQVDGEGEDYPLRYICPACKRSIPWCHGADDAHFALCDDCAMHLVKLK